MTTGLTNHRNNGQLLRRRIGDEGDALWSPPLPDSDDGQYVGLHDRSPPWWSLYYRARLRVNHAPEFEQGGLLILAFLILIPLDAIQVVLRLFLFPWLQLLWWGERSIAILLKRSFSCPICHNIMKDPYVYCTKCQRVQGMLYPTFGSLFFKTCPGCIRKERKPKSWWRTLGNHLIRPPSPLVCRDTPVSKGCYRPHRLNGLAGRFRSEHVAVLGPTLRTKHSTLGHLMCHAVTPSTRARRTLFRPAWSLSELEMRLADEISQGLYQNTKSCERLGKKYTLARSFVLRGGRKKLLTIHNLCHSWLANEERLFTRGISWGEIRGLAFVVDLYLLKDTDEEAILSHVELLSRTIRVIEKDLPLLPGTPLPIRVAVVLPISDSDPLANTASLSGALDKDRVAALIAEQGPAFNALVKRSVPKKNLSYFGGTLPSNGNFQRSEWVRDIFDWIM